MTLPSHKSIEQILRDNSGIRLDIGCGEDKQPGFVGMDIQDLPEVDIVQDWNVHPWQLPDESVVVALASHVVEHIPPCTIDNGKTRFPFMEFMNEVWRVMRVNSQFVIVTPYATSPQFYQDPTHCNPCNEKTWYYFDPSTADGILYDIYKPKPWKLEHIYWSPEGNIELSLRKVKE